MNPPPRHHLFIVGTGRAGTTLLVRYLAAMGLDTHLAHHGETAWDEQAKAGLEDVPSPDELAALPYVVKSPWFYEFVDQLLADGRIVLDAVILPVRDLAEAAASRAVLELRSIHQATPWMATMEQSWESWGRTPGGVVYSVNPLDQARLLALGFHHVVQRLVRAGVPVILLDFPRLVHDADYLHRSLHAVLPPGVTREAALAAHQAVADPALVRVGEELEAASPPRPIAAHPTPSEIDRIAIRRELVRLREELDAARAALEAGRLAADIARAAHDAALTAAHETAQDAAREAAGRLAEAMLARDQEAAAAAAARAEVDRLQHAATASEHELTEMRAAIAAIRTQAAAARDAAAQEAEALRTAIDIIRGSTSWRLTRPLRALAILFGR